MKSVVNNAASNELLMKDNELEILYDDVVPSTGATAIGNLFKDETACETSSKMSNIHSSKAQKNEVNIETAKIFDHTIDKEVNSASGSTLKLSEQIRNECNQKTNKTDEQRHTNIIGSGPSYTGGGIKNTFHGISYQMKLSMLYIIRGLKQKHKFEVGTEVKEAGKLDDLIFLCEDDEVGFLQAKHKLNEDVTVNEDQLLSTEGDLSISKYFHSYLQILSKKEFGNVLKDRNMVLIMNTNIGIDSSVLNNSFELVTASSRLSGNKILALGTEMERTGYYIFNKCSPLYNTLVGLLGELEEPSSRVAANLAKAVVNNKKKSIKIDELFDGSREWLLRNVLEVGEEIIKTQKKYFVKFKESFLSGSEKSVSVFRKTFFETYMSNIRPAKKNTPSTQDTMNEHIIKQDLFGVKFQIPKVFALTSKNKTVTARQDEVRKFLDALVFAVNQPNEIKLGDIIEKEIGDYVGHTDRKSIASKFKLYIQDWAKQKEGRYLTKEDVECNFAVWGQETLNQIKMDDVKKYKCTFEDNNEVITKLSHFLKTENDANVLCLYDRERLLTEIKVCQVLERFTSENLDQQFIFCDINDLIELEDTVKCPVKALSSQTCNIMFISLNKGKLHSNEEHILHRLLQIHTQRKRLIISIPDEKKFEFVNKFCLNKLGIKCVFVEDFDNSFSDLDEKSRRQLIEGGCIKLHGISVKGLLSESDLTPYVRDEMLLKMITSELEINVAFLLTDQYYEEVNQYYINRSLIPVIVDQKILNDTRFRIVRESTPQETIYNDEVIIISSNEQYLYDNLHKTNRKNTVHWLKETSDKYVWITSQGTLSNLREYVTAQDEGEHENCIPITKVSDLKKDVVLIRAVPGMGKSTLLSHIAEQSKKEDTSFFVFKTNLEDYCTELYSLGENKVTLRQAIRFTFFATQIESRQIEESKSAFNLLTIQDNGSINFCPNTSNFGYLEHIRARVFSNLYNTEKIVLLLDGFDQIAPKYCTTTLNLLQTLKHSKVRKMWVTTRSYNITESLEIYLETFAYTLKPLSEDEQITFIEKFWGHKIKSQGTEIRSFVKSFFNSLTTSALSALNVSGLTKQDPNKMISSFMGVPLHSYMLGKVLTNDFIKFYLQNTDIAVACTVIEVPFTIFDLYSKFFDIKFDEILHSVNLKHPKNYFFEEEKKRVKTNLGKLALLEMFDDKLLTELIADEDRIELKDFVKSGTEKSGIVAEVVDDRPRFVHRSFAEYFAGEYLAKLLLHSVENKKKAAANSLLYNCVTINSEYYYVLFNFFNYRVVSGSKNKEIFEAAIGGNTRKLVNRNMTEMLDPLNRTPVHFIAFNLFNVLNNFHSKQYAEMHRSNYAFFVMRLFSATFLCPDTLFKWTPMHYLALCPSLPTLKEWGPLYRHLNNVTQDSVGRTPLMLLIISDSPFNNNYFNPSCLTQLIAVDTQDCFSYTALQYVLERLKKKHITMDFGGFETPPFVLLICLYMIEFLLKKGASIIIPNIRGTRPVDIIKEYILNLLQDDKIKNYVMNGLGRELHHKSAYVYPNFVKNCAKSIENIIYKYEHNTFDIVEVSSHDHMSTTAYDYTVQQNGAQPDIASREGESSATIERREKIIEDFMKHIQLRRLNLFNIETSSPDPESAKSISLAIDKLPPVVVERLLGTTDLLTLPTDDDDHKDVIIFILTSTKLVRKILLFRIPHLVDVVDSKGRTALHYAVKQRDLDSITYLIENNARVDILDNEGKMPAHVQKSDILHQMHVMQDALESTRTKADDLVTLEITDMLPFQVANLLVLTMNLYPILTQNDADVIVYVLSQTRTIASVLMSHYPDAVNTKDSKGRTVLHYAVKMKDRSAVCSLINNNAQVNIADNDGKYPAHLEMENPFPQSNLELQRTYEDQNKKMLSFIDTLPFKVAKPLVLTMALYPPNTGTDYLPFIFDQLHTVASVLWTEYSGLLRTTILKENCSYLDYNEISNEVVCMLLQSYFIEDFSENALNSNDVLKLVVELFSSVENNDLSQVLTILRCVEYSLVRPSLANVNLLSDQVNVAACVVNSRSEDGGKTALHYVAQTGNVEIAQCLLSHGACYDAPDSDGYTPIMVAETYNNTEVFDLLKKVNVVFYGVAKKLHISVQSVVLYEEIDGNLFHCINTKILLPLIHLALRSNDRDLLKLLMKCYRFKADFFDCRSLKGITVVDVMREMNLDVAKFLELNDFPSELNDLLMSSFKYKT